MLPEHVFNLDEPALTVLMLAQTGWAKISDAKGEIRFLGSDEKPDITLTLVVSKTGDMSAAPPLDWRRYSRRKNHWISVTTLQEILCLIEWTARKSSC